MRSFVLVVVTFFVAASAWGQDYNSARYGRRSALGRDSRPEQVVVPSGGQTATVMVDDQSYREYGYGGHSNGYRYSRDMSAIAKQETERVLKSLGVELVLNIHEVGQHQEELELENSPWSTYGADNNPVGYFRGAADIWKVSAYVSGGRDSYARARTEHFEPSAALSRLEVLVVLRRTSTRTREIGEIYQGKANTVLAKNLQVRARSGNPWYALAGSLLEVATSSWSTEEGIVREAVRKALKGYGPSVFVQPTAGSPALSPSPPSYIFLSLNGYANEGERFGIWRDKALIAEVEVTEILRDGQARCRVLRASVSDLGRSGDSARPLTPVIPVEEP